VHQRFRQLEVRANAVENEQRRQRLGAGPNADPQPVAPDPQVAAIDRRAARTTGTTGVDRTSPRHQRSST
jgi:hypothetical protein